MSSQTRIAIRVALPSSHTRTGGSRGSVMNSQVALTLLVVSSVPTSSAASSRWPRPHTGSRSCSSPRTVFGAVLYGPSSKKSRWPQPASQPLSGCAGFGGTTGIDSRVRGIMAFTAVPSRGHGR